MSFGNKQISYSISLAEGGGTANLTGLRSSCRIVVYTLPGMGTASIVIFGMTLSQMNENSVVGTQFNRVAKNKITITVSDGESSSVVFSGTILLAYVDASSMPEVAFRIEAIVGAEESVLKSKPTSVQGTADAAQTLQQLAKKMNLQFENNGVKAKISNLYLSSSWRQQALELVEMVGAQAVIDNGTLAVWPAGKSRQGGGETVISKETGMVTSPAFESASIIVTCYLKPEFRIGQEFTVKSQFTAANGKWVATRVDYDISSLTPHGPWFCTLYGAPASAAEQPPGAGGPG